MTLLQKDKIMTKLSEKIRHIWLYAKEVLTSNNFEYIIWYNGSNGAGIFCLCKKYPWENAMEWGASVADAMTYEGRIDLANLMTGILDGVACSIAEDMKKEKQKKEGEKA